MRLEPGKISRSAVCEHKLPLDIRRMARSGGLVPGDHEWSWRRGRDESCIVYQVGFDRRSVRLMYADPRKGLTIRDLFVVEWLPCRFGGSRPWFICKWCKGRCAIIFGTSADGHFACRKCLKLHYAVENETKCNRAWRAYHKVVERLGDGLERPARMRVSTYLALLERAMKMQSLALGGERHSQ